MKREAPQGVEAPRRFAPLRVFGRLFHWLCAVLNGLVCGVLIFLVRVYQVTLSPLFGNCCRFTPSCSRYCIEALKVHGAVYGTWLTLKRLGRCRPFGPYGYDPVPPKRIKKKV